MPDPAEIAAAIVKVVIPTADDSAARQLRWRQVMGACVLGLIFTTALAFGLIPLLHPGFSKTSDLQQLSLTIASNRATDLAADHEWQAGQLDTKLLELRKEHCKASEENKVTYWQRISWALNQYKKLTGTDWQLPNCSEL